MAGQGLDLLADQQVVLERLLHLAVKMQHRLVAALAGDQEGPVPEVYVPQVQADQLAFADARSQKERDDGDVPHTEVFVIGLLPVAQPLAGVDRVKETSDFLLVQEDHRLFVDLGHGQVGRHVFADQAVGIHVFIERADGAQLPRHADLLVGDEDGVAVGVRHFAAAFVRAHVLGEILRVLFKVPQLEHPQLLGGDQGHGRVRETDVLLAQVAQEQPQIVQVSQPRQLAGMADHRPDKIRNRLRHLPLEFTDAQVGLHLFFVLIGLIWLLGGHG